MTPVSGKRSAHGAKNGSALSADPFRSLHVTPKSADRPVTMVISGKAAITLLHGEWYMRQAQVRPAFT